MFTPFNKPNNNDNGEKKDNFRVQFFLKSSKRKGIVKIFCNVSVRRKRAATPFSTGIHIKKSCWDNNAKTIKCSGHETDNYLLDTIRTELTEIYIRIKNEKEEFTAEDIKQAYVDLETKVEQKTMLELYKYWLADVEKDIGKTIVQRTFAQYTPRFEHLTNYLDSLKKPDMMPYDIDIHFATKFGIYLKREYNMTHNYAMRSIQQLNRVMKWAIQEGYIKDNGMEHFKYNFDAPEAPIFLTPDQLSGFQKFRFKSPSLQRVADAFILQCWTSMDYIDIIQFKKEQHLQFKDTKWYIVKKRGKAALTNTGQLMQCPLNINAKRIWEKYDWQPPLWSDKHKKCMSGDKYRKYLKECAEIVGIEINVVTKTARKTFINLMYERGMLEEDISKMVGHNNIKTTNKFYIKFSTKRITMGVRKAFGDDFMVG